VITIVCGAPGSGKTTYVAERHLTGDVIVDMDKLALALTTPDVAPYEYSDLVRQVAFYARQAAVKEALKLAQSNRSINVWIIHTDPSPNQVSSYRILGAKLVWLDPGKDVCLERVKERPARQAKIAEKVIREYYAKRK
jgi:predicted kinase